MTQQQIHEDPDLATLMGATSVISSEISTRPIISDLIKAEAKSKLGQFKQVNVDPIIPAHKGAGLLKVQSANQWMQEASQRPIPKMLFGEFWYEGELAILFADTNQGKSILAVQIADSISRGKPIKGFRLEAAKQTVIYVDFELSDKQFENRYSKEYTEPYRFDEGFLRVELNPNFEIPKAYTGFEEYLIAELEETIKTTNSQIVILDNITYLRADNERAKDALPLMKQLKNLKDKYSLSILVLSHTPKRDLHKPLTRNDIQGSKMIVNFCDSAFAIGESSQGNDIRYLKQIKVRATGLHYGEDNVMVCRIEKAFNFLCFNHLSYSCEGEHLKVATDSDRQERNQQAKLMRAQGKTNVEIADLFGVSEGAVRKWFKTE